MRKRVNTARRGEGGSFWLSFSDLMSCLVLIIILVMFYIIYQYFALAESNAREIEAQKAQLVQQQTALEDAQATLAEQQTELETAQATLLVRETELEDAQTALAAQQTELETAQATLATQQSALDDAEAQLSAQQAALTQAQDELEAQTDALNAAQLSLADKEDEVARAQSALDSLGLTLSQRESQLEEAQRQLNAAQTRLDDQQAQLSAQQAQLEQLVGIRPRIIASLSEALRESSITASVDSATGAITMESDVLFTSGKFDLNSSGKAFIDRLLPVYLGVVFREEYAPYISEIIIEGHTDSDGSFLDNLQLSQRRALAVAEYILSSDCRSVPNDLKNRLRPVMTVNGRSYSDRVFLPNGMEDKDASRRVVFKFRMTDEQMIEQLRAILENE